MVFDLCEEPHPRINVPPGTVCDYDMEKGLICKYPEGSAPAVMSSAAYLDPVAAAAESAIPAEMLQQVVAQQEEDNGSSYTAADDGATSDASAASYAGDQVQAPVADPAGVKYVMNLQQQQQQQRLTHPGIEEQHFHTRNIGVQDVKLIGNARNGHASTWVTEAVRGAGLSTA